MNSSSTLTDQARTFHADHLGKTRTETLNDFYRLAETLDPAHPDSGPTIEAARSSLHRDSRHVGTWTPEAAAAYQALLADGCRHYGPKTRFSIYNDFLREVIILGSINTPEIRDLARLAGWGWVAIGDDCWTGPATWVGATGDGNVRHGTTSALSDPVNPEHVPELLEVDNPEHVATWAWYVANGAEILPADLRLLDDRTVSAVLVHDRHEALAFALT